MRSKRDALDALVTAAREAEGPTAADRARIRAALMAKVAPPTPPTSGPVRTLSGPAVGGITAVVVAVGVGLLAPRRAPPTRRPIAAVTVSSEPPATPRASPSRREVRTDVTTTPRPAPLLPPGARRRPRVTLPETEVTVSPAPLPPVPPPPEVVAPSPEPLPAPSLAPASGSGRATPADTSAGLPPDLLVLAEARALLRAGDARGALVRLERFAAEHPEAPRAAERSGARLIARCAEGIAGTGEVREYLSRHGDSPLAAGVRDRCAALIPPR